MWDKENNWPAFEQQAMMKYQAWKAERKPKHILASIPGIVDVYKSKGYNTDEATYAAKSNWIDTSDEDVPENESKDEPDSINFSSEIDRALFAAVHIPAKKPSQTEINLVDLMLRKNLKDLRVVPCMSKWYQTGKVRQWWRVLHRPISQVWRT
ncbi:unnamed protein product [Calypogeia fissa]